MQTRAHIKRLTNRNFENEFLSTHVPIMFALGATAAPHMQPLSRMHRALVVDVDLTGNGFILFGAETLLQIHTSKARWLSPSPGRCPFPWPLLHSRAYTYTYQCSCRYAAHGSKFRSTHFRTQ